MWGQKLTPNQVAAFNGPVTALYNGQVFRGNPRDIPLTKHAQIPLEMLGALLEETECLSPATAIRVLEAKVKNPALLELDGKALEAGRLYIGHTVAVGAVTQSPPIPSHVPA